MKLTDEMIEALKKDLSGAKNYSDLMGPDGAIKKLIKKSLESMLETELADHLGYEKYSSKGKNSGNSRNGFTTKSIRNDNGEIELNVPRDRNGEFDPIIVEKYQRTLGPIEDKIISMYAKGMTVRDIQSYVEEMYGLEVSPTLISQITNKILDLANEWQVRPLETVYPIVFLDAIYFKTNHDRKVVNKAAYTCLAIDSSGKKDLLGIWIGETEGSHFWLSVLTELKNRGVKDILIACIDGLNGFPEAINTVFPKAEIQLCVVHLIRNTLKYIVSKDTKPFLRDLKTVYTAPTEESAKISLEKINEKWGKKYPMAIKVWQNNWQYSASFYKYPGEIRKIIYTTNAVEAVHRQIRKVTKTKSIFPNDDALKKMLFLVYRDLSKKWNRPIHNWGIVYSHFSIIFKERMGKI